MPARAIALVISTLLLVTIAVSGSATAAPAGSDGGLPDASPVGAGRREKLPALAAPTVPDGLLRALARGQVSEGRYALERAVSLFDLGRVRSRFGQVARPAPRSATILLRDLVLRLDRLTASELRIARRILARPTDGARADPDGYAVAEETPVCATHSCVHYVGSTQDQPAPEDSSGGPAPDYVETVSAVMESVWAAEVGAHGYRAPKSDIHSEENGGSALLDIYLVDIGDEGLYGYCTSDDPNLAPSYEFWDMSAYCVLDNDYHVSQFGYPDPTDPLEVTAAHEFFHAVQFAYDFFEDAWLMESTSTWMEERVYDAIDDNRQYLGSSPLAQPLIPLDRSGGIRMYGTWIFWAFLTEYLGGAVPDATIVRGIWSRADGSQAGRDMYSTQALAAAVGARRIGGTRWRFRWAFADFAVWNARPARYYDEGGAYQPAPVAKTVTLTRTTASTTQTAKIDHLANRYVVLRRGAGLKATARLRIVVDAPGNAAAPEASVVVIRKSGASASKGIGLDLAGDGATTVVFDTTVSRVVVIVTNASVRYKNCYAGITTFACFGGVPVDQKRLFSFRATVV